VAQLERIKGYNGDGRGWIMPAGQDVEEHVGGVNTLFECFIADGFNGLKIISLLR
jgi:hypothetical protein